MIDQKQINLPRLVNDVMNTLQPLFAKKKLYFTSKIDNNLTDIYLDPDRLRQVFYNYISNAIKFTPQNGTIQIRVLAEGGDHLRIEVEDTGIGIRSDDIPRLFVEFQQLDSSVTKKYAGTGLGLALVKHIVEAQSGYVGVTSEINKGSTFYAVLPQHYQTK